jgi:hypothetical protein
MTDKLLPRPPVPGMGSRYSKRVRSGNPGAADLGGYFNHKESICCKFAADAAPVDRRCNCLLHLAAVQSASRVASAGRAVFARFPGSRAGADPCPLTWTQPMPHGRPRA